MQGQLSLWQSRFTSYQHCSHIGRPPTPGPGVLRLLAKCCNVHLKLFRSRVQIWSLRPSITRQLLHIFSNCAFLGIFNSIKGFRMWFQTVLSKVIWLFKSKNIISSSTNSIPVRGIGSLGSLFIENIARRVQLELQKRFIRWSNMQLQSHEE